MSDEQVIFRIPIFARYSSLIGTLILGGVSACMLGCAIIILFIGWWWLGIFVAAVASFIAGLCGHVLRDLRGKWGLRIELLPDRMVLDLPAGRSLIHRPVEQHLTIPYGDVEAVETRLEAYASLGTDIRRVYVLVLKRGDHFFLFEDRALGSQFETPMVSKIASAIVERAHIPLRDLGMVEGRGGFLSMWGAHAPDWAAPSLPMAQQLRVWRHAAATGAFAIAVIIFAIVLRLIVGP